MRQCLSPRPHEAPQEMPVGAAGKKRVSVERSRYVGQVKAMKAVREYHAHVYFDAESRERAAELRTRVEQEFTVRIGPMRDGPVGPHRCAQYLIAFDAEQFSTLVPFLMMNRTGLTWLVHPLSGHSLDDHTLHAMWAGEVLPVDVAFLREAEASRRSSSASDKAVPG
jgi:aromatic ring-cleaving dioxygenase